MSAYIDTFYRRTLVDERRYPPLSGEIAVDACIIGGGLESIGGESTALEQLGHAATVS